MDAFLRKGGAAILAVSRRGFIANEMFCNNRGITGNDAVTKERVMTAEGFRLCHGKGVRYSYRAYYLQMDRQRR